MNLLVSVRFRDNRIRVLLDVNKYLLKELAIPVGSQILSSSASMNEKLEGADLVGAILLRVFQFPRIIHVIEDHVPHIS